MNAFKFTQTRILCTHKRELVPKNNIRNQIGNKTNAIERDKKKMKSVSNICNIYSNGMIGQCLRAFNFKCVSQCASVHIHYE